MPKKNLKELLSDNGITQNEFAKKAGLSIPEVRKIIRQKRGSYKIKREVRATINMLILEDRISGHVGDLRIDDFFD